MRRGALLSLVLLAVLALAGCAGTTNPSTSAGAGSTAATTETGTADAGSSSAGATASGTGVTSTGTSTASTGGGSNRAPAINTFTVNKTTGLAPLKVSFRLNATDADKDALTYKLSFGDGSANATGSLPSGDVTHSYSLKGNFTAKLTVTDGKISANKTLVVAVAGVAAAGGVFGSKEQWYFSKDSAAEVCNADFLIDTLASVAADDSFCQFQIVNSPAVSLAEVATAQTPSHGFPTGAAIAGIIHFASRDPIVGTAPQPTAGTLSVSVSLSGGATLGSASGMVQVASADGYSSFEFSFTASEAVPPGSVLVLGIDYSGPSGAITWGGGADKPTGFAIGGAYTPGVPA